jgi:hypothetical protein
MLGSLSDERAFSHQPTLCDLKRNHLLSSGQTLLGPQAIIKYWWRPSRTLLHSTFSNFHTYSPNGPLLESFHTETLDLMLRR